MKHTNGFKRINNCDGGKGRARRAYHKACRIKYEVWQVEDEVIGFTPVIKVDEKNTIEEAREACEEYELILWKFEDVVVHTGIKHGGVWVE